MVCITDSGVILTLRKDQMRTRTTYLLSTILLICISVSCIHHALGIDYKDAPTLEPYPLTQKLIRELTHTDSKVNADRASFRLKGIAIKTSDQTNSSIRLSAETDHRLNLWRGRPNDLASSHLGSMKIVITSIIDENGKNIHDTSHDKPWSDKVTVYNFGDGIFRGSRSVNFRKDSKETTVAQVSGKIKLSLPVNLNKYVIRAGSTESTKSLLERNEISKVELKNGIYIRHPKPTPEFRASIMGFNSKGERISITSAGSAGGKRDNHWYYFSKDTPFDKMIIFIPGKFIDLEISFTIDVQNE